MRQIKRERLLAVPFIVDMDAVIRLLHDGNRGL